MATPSAAPVVTPVAATDKVFTTPSLPDDVTKTYRLELKKIGKEQQSLVVEANESLGQYAEWLNTPVDSIRKIIRKLKFFSNLCTMFNNLYN